MVFGCYLYRPVCTPFSEFCTPKKAFCTPINELSMHSYHNIAILAQCTPNIARHIQLCGYYWSNVLVYRWWNGMSHQYACC